MQEQWQKEQAAKCPCRGSDEMCPCQNVMPGDRPPSAATLLEWMTHHHLPLQLWREAEGSWVVVDNWSNHVLGSGETAEDAILAAHRREAEKEQSN